MSVSIASTILSGCASTPLAQITDLVTRFQRAKLALKDVSDIVTHPIKCNPERKCITLDNVQGSITFENMSFKYQASNNSAVGDLRLTIKLEGRTDILGRIGSGKSAMLKLISGLCDTEKGNITLDGIDVRQLDPDFLRGQVLLLNQSLHPSPGTLCEDMDLARIGNYPTDQDLLIALNRSGLGKIIYSHPRGSDMPLGEDGLDLSGGQK